MSSATAMISVCETRTLRRQPGQPPIRRVVAGVEAQAGIGRNGRGPAPIEARPDERIVDGVIADDEVQVQPAGASKASPALAAAFHEVR